MEFHRHDISIMKYNDYNIILENHNFQSVNPLSMAMFYSYVKLPDGIFLMFHEAKAIDWMSHRYWPIVPGMDDTHPLDPGENSPWTLRNPGSNGRQGRSSLPRLIDYSIRNNTQMLHVWHIYQHLSHRWPSFAVKYATHGAYGIIKQQT